MNNNSTSYVHIEVLTFNTSITITSTTTNNYTINDFPPGQAGIIALIKFNLTAALQSGPNTMFRVSSFFITI